MTANIVAYVHTWTGSASLGIKLVPRGKSVRAQEGVVVSDFTIGASPAVKENVVRGMVVLKINGEDVGACSHKEILLRIKKAGRPLTMKFSEPIDVPGLKPTTERTFVQVFFLFNNASTLILTLTLTPISTFSLA